MKYVGFATTGFQDAKSLISLKYIWHFQGFDTSYISKNPDNVSVAKSFANGKFMSEQQISMLNQWVYYDKRSIIKSKEA